MTKMRRICVPIPQATDEKILELRGKEGYARMTYSGIVRELLERGLACAATGAADLRRAEEPQRRGE